MKKQSSFTLIELLVVIAIIAVLAGMLLPGLSAVQNHARKTKAKVAMNGLKMAVSMYESDYSILPVSSASGTPDKLVLNEEPSSMTGNTTKYDDLIDILQGDNPRKKIYLDIVNEVGKGVYRDPWEQNYIVALDLNYDGDIPSDNPASPSNGPVYDKDGDGTGDNIFERAAIWSRGKDLENDLGLDDDVTTWK